MTISKIYKMCTLFNLGLQQLNFCTAPKPILFSNFCSPALEWLRFRHLEGVAGEDRRLVLVGAAELRRAGRVVEAEAVRLPHPDPVLHPTRGQLRLWTLHLIETLGGSNFCNSILTLQQDQEATSFHTFAPLQLGFQLLHRAGLKFLFLVAEHMLGAEPRRWAERREGEIRRCWTSGPYRRDPSRRWPSR